MESNKSAKDSISKSQPSCELCQRRKVRCDKGNPCSTCRRASVKCEVSTRQRLPRGRNGGRRKGDTDLKARIAKLENLVSNLGGDTASSTTSPVHEPGEVHDGIAQKGPSSDMSRYLGSSFWSNLTNEVHGLREVLDDTSDDDAETPERNEPTNTQSGMASRGFNFVLCGPDSFMMAPNALENPPRHLVEVLYTLYFQNVDPLFKILHAPSLADFMFEGKPYLDYSPGDPAVTALSFAVYYAGLSTLDPQSCKQRFDEEKTDLLNKYRFAFEVCLAKADFVNSSKIEVLQALVIFLASVRVNDRSRWSWTLLALAVRMAEAIGLRFNEGSSSCKPFETEMRRRLWHALGGLDINAAIDRGTEPMLAGKLQSVQVPANVNDTDIYPGMEAPISSREGFTDMSFSLMGHDGEPLVRKLVYVQGGETRGERLEIEQNWHKRQEDEQQSVSIRKYEYGRASLTANFPLAVRHFTQSMQEKYLRHCDMTVPFHWFAKQVGEVMASGLMLFTIRPMHLHPQVKAPRMEDSSVLNLAVDILAKHDEILTTPFTEPWRWFVWVQWHALAVALAELCSRTEGPDIERAWRVVDIAFQRYAEQVADTERGMLWQPIEKLMKRAKQNREIARIEMANLRVQDQAAAFTNAVAPTPGPDIPSKLSLTDSRTPLQNQGLDPGAGMYHAAGNPLIGLWNAGLLGPGSINPSTPLMQTNMDGLASTAGLNDTGSLPLDPPALSSTENAGFPLDMAWTSWEDFVGDVNLTDFDPSDPTAGFPQS